MNKAETTTVKRSFTLNLIFFLVAYVAIVAGIGYWVWLNALKFENDVIKRTQQQLLTIARSESQRIEGFISTALSDGKILAKDPLIIKYLKDDLKAKSTLEAANYTVEYLFEHFKGKVDFIHWLDAKGILVGGFPFVEEIIGRDESWNPDVKFILENHNSSIDVFEANSGEKFLCLCNAVIENGNFLGLLRVLVSLETINNLVSTVRAGGKGYAWIITEQGIMIAHPKPEHRGVNILAVRKKAFPDFDWSELEDVVNKMESGEEGVGTYQSAWWTEEKLEIIRKLTAFSPINMSAWQELWSIGISLSYDEIAGPIKRNALNNFIGAGSSLLVFGVGGIILFRVQRKSAEMEIIAKSVEELRVLNEKLQSEIIERKRGEDQVHKLSRVVEQSPNIIMITDTNGNIEYVNPVFTEITGYTSEDALNQNPRILKSGKTPQGTYEQMWKTITSGQKWSGEFCNRKKNGELYWELAHISPIKDSEGGIIHFVAIKEDNTKRKRMEEELVKAQKLESIGVLAGGIAHDFNNYLQGILSNIALAKSYTDSNDKIYTYLTESEEAVVLAKQLSKQLLTFSKGGNPIRETIYVSRLIKDCCKFATRGSSVRCESDIPDCFCLVEADKGQMYQVFNNLFVNANQAMPEGGVIKVNAEHCNVEKKDLLPLKTGRHVKISIKDQGTGISQKYLQKVFDPYFTTKEEGSGLGLATSYSIIKKHGGYIAVESEEGTGTTFHIYLPTLQKKISKETVIDKTDVSRTELAKGEHVQNEALLDGKSILLMDDELIILKSVSQQLKELQYEVKTVKNGTEAIEMYKRAMGSNKSFDAVVMDLTIPGGMGGEEAIKELLKIDPGVKAIVASGYSDDPIMTNFGEYGFKGMVEKPYEIYELEEVLQKVIIEQC